MLLYSYTSKDAVSRRSGGKPVNGADRKIRACPGTAGVRASADSGAATRGRAVAGQ